MGETTDKLNEILRNTKPDHMADYLEKNRDVIESSDRPFTDFYRERIKGKGLRVRDILIAADISDKYGNQLIAQEKHTKNRDVIIRLCLAGRFSYDEMQRALKLYGMSPLYAKIGRDAVIIMAIHNNMFEIARVDDALRARGFEILSRGE